MTTPLSYARGALLVCFGFTLPDIKRKVTERDSLKAASVAAAYTQTKTKGTKMPVSFRTACQWIADNDSPDNNDSVEHLSGYLSVVLVADIYRHKARYVAEKVHEIRNPPPPPPRIIETTIYARPEVFTAFDAEAEKHSVPLTEWLRDCCCASLPHAVRQSLSPTRTRKRNRNSGPKIQNRISISIPADMKEAFKKESLRRRYTTLNAFIIASGMANLPEDVAKGLTGSPPPE